MRNNGWKSMLLITLAALIITISLPHGSAAASDVYSYDDVILEDQPVGYWALDSKVPSDQTGHGHDGAFTGDPVNTVLPNGDTAVVFNGIDQYYTIPDHDDLELTKNGILTIEAWMRPDTLEFTKQQSSGYVHWMGKGEPGQHSWASRMYSYTNTENRPNRISGYSFNLAGGLGAGSYFQDPVTVGEWIHYVLVINTVDVSNKYPTGYTKIYKNGVLRDQDVLAGYNIIPGNGTAPIRIGTRDFGSFFEGAIGKVAIYDYELTAEQLTRHYSSMMNGITVQEMVANMEQIKERSGSSDLIEEALEEMIALYGTSQVLLDLLPQDDGYVEQLRNLLAAAQRDIIDSMNSFLSAQKPGSAYRIAEPLLAFLIDFAIQETGARNIRDQGIVQDYVMSIVKSHATGNAVEKMIILRLSQSGQ
ncbi:LamG domain-containing protein [Paenibacillus sp. Cedars]|uniref:LamG domain-containing protein n=1 Tax=Paenibacillus sp. Cedars TaxID=1980674 RepID=UPI001164E9C6|nr:LamG domain-containing protein [Paenibacillus sp. Cedars]AWP27720.1 hypothetical protein B9D94_14320 [Paenibacillus sp. Cedars]